MRGLEKNCTRWHIQTDRQTNTHTDGHGDSKTNSAKRAELVKIYSEFQLICAVLTSLLIKADQMFSYFLDAG